MIVVFGWFYTVMFIKLMTLHFEGDITGLAHCILQHFVRFCINLSKIDAEKNIYLANIWIIFWHQIKTLITY